MATNFVYDCDGCGLTIPDGSVTTALLLTAYDQATGTVHHLQFAWDHGCGARAMEAVRDEFNKPNIGSVNAIPLPPTSTPAPVHFPQGPSPSNKMEDPDYFYGPLPVLTAPDGTMLAQGFILAAAASVQAPDVGGL